MKIVVSKFYGLRLYKHSMVGTPGTHSVCVCTLYQNVKLMASGVKLEYLIIT